MNLRRVCLTILSRWDAGEAYAEDILESVCAQENISGTDRTFCHNLVYGVLRNRTLLDHWIEHMRSGGVDPDNRRVLHLGLYQMLMMRVPDHAAVNETVGLSSKKGRGLVNALLRRAGREREVLTKLVDSVSIPIRYSIPKFLYEGWVKRFGEKDAKALCEWNQQPAKAIARLNRLHPEAENAMSDASQFESVEGHEDFFRILGKRHLAAEKGYCYFQDPATLIACKMLNPSEHETVFDVCAAPGGKSIYMAQLMKNSGKLFAFDSSERRLKRLQQNLIRMGVGNSGIVLHDWATGIPEMKCDAALVDVPCSNTGVLRRRVDVRWRITRGSIAELATLQTKILNNAAKTVKPGGRLVYSTCSLESEENEAVVESFVSRIQGWRCEKMETSVPVRTGIDGAFSALLIKKG